MRGLRLTLSLTFALGIALGSAGQLALQQQKIKRTDVLSEGVAGVEGNDAHMWVAEVPPGAATGKHRHPTPRFVYVLAGAVTLEVEGQAPRTFKAGEAFQEPPDVTHNFRNASETESAKALGFQIAGKSQPLQY